MEEDISKKSVAVLLILVTILSLIGTFAVMNEIQKIKVQGPVQVPKNPTAEVKIHILTPEEAAPPVSTGTGLVIINILPNKNIGG